MLPDPIEVPVRGSETDMFYLLSSGPGVTTKRVNRPPFATGPNNVPGLTLAAQSVSISHEKTDKTLRRRSLVRFDSTYRNSEGGLVLASAYAVVDIPSNVDAQHLALDVVTPLIGFFAGTEGRDSYQVLAGESQSNVSAFINGEP